MCGNLEAGFQAFVDNYKKCVLSLGFALIAATGLIAATMHCSD